MNLTPGNDVTKTAIHDAVRMEMADDLLLLAGLIDRAVRRETIVDLWAHCYDGLLRLDARSSRLRGAVEDFCQALTEIPTCFDRRTSDMLQRDFVRIHGRGGAAGPDRSSSMVADEGDRRIPIGAVCRWGGRRGHQVTFWSFEDDGDHLAKQLRYLAFSIAPDGIAAPAETVTDFLDHYLAHCVDDYVAAVDGQASTGLYRTLAALVSAYVAQVRLLCREGLEPGLLPAHGTWRAIPPTEAGIQPGPGNGRVWTGILRTSRQQAVAGGN
jgi:hypothetical protein